MVGFGASSFESGFGFDNARGDWFFRASARVFRAILAISVARIYLSLGTRERLVCFATAAVDTDDVFVRVVGWTHRS